jgi:hypothetical protein
VPTKIGVCGIYGLATILFTSMYSYDAADALIHLGRRQVFRQMPIYLFSNQVVRETYQNLVDL